METSHSCRSKIKQMLEKKKEREGERETSKNISIPEIHLHCVDDGKHPP